MSNKKVIHTDEAPAAIGPYSQANASDSLLFTAGQIPISPIDGNIVGPTIEEQTYQVMDNLKAVVEAGGSSLDKVVKTTIFITDFKNFKTVNSIYAEYFEESPPARSTVQVAALPLGSLIEIEAIALR